MALDNPALSAEETEKIKQRFAAVHPLNRIGDPIQVANLILYLASTESEFT
jgi:NAD(P)-dependent dehydrogenase (short-subunit alcohol dehydrogenase family)